LRIPLFEFLIASALTCFAAPLAAQTPPPGTPTQPAATTSAASSSDTKYFAGLVTGAGWAKNASSVFGVEAGARVWRNVDVFAEFAHFSDVVTQAQIDVAAPLVDYLQRTQGKPASADLKMPAFASNFGARWVFEQTSMPYAAKPYALFSLGATHVNREPTFTLGGTDITNSLPQYGITLQSDLTGDETQLSVTGGAGVIVPYRMLYFDLGYRLMSIRLSEAINVNRLHISIGARF